MFPIEATDPNNVECFRITSVQGLFSSPILLMSPRLPVYYQYQSSDICWQKKSTENYNAN